MIIILGTIKGKELILRIRSIVVSFIFVVILCQSGFSWDGERKGFILGFGAGFGSLNFTQEISYLGTTVSGSEHHLPLFTNFKIGGAPTDQLLIYWSSKVSWFPIENALNETVTIIAGTGTVSLSYYWMESAPSWFLSGGLGYSTWDTPFEEGGKTWLGTGAFIGGGYEFSPHMSIEGGFNLGDPSTSESGINATTTHTNLYISVNALGY